MSNKSITGKIGLAMDIFFFSYGYIKIRNCRVLEYIVSYLLTIIPRARITSNRDFKDVRAHCYCAFLLRTPFIGRARATSYIKRANRAKHLTKRSADGPCVNFVWEYFCWIHGDPRFFFDRSLRFLILSIITKHKQILYEGSFNYFAFTIHMGSNCYINTGVRDLKVALLI